MARLIDADKLLKGIDELKKSPWFNEGKDGARHDYYIVRKQAVNIVSKCIEQAETCQPDKTDLIMRVVRAALCSKKQQYINVDTEGYVTMHPVSRMATLVQEVERIDHYHCSACHTVYSIAAQGYKFCPECGAEFEKDGDPDAR